MQRDLYQTGGKLRMGTRHAWSLATTLQSNAEWLWNWGCCLISSNPCSGFAAKLHQGSNQTWNSTCLCIFTQIAAFGVRLIITGVAAGGKEGFYLPPHAMVLIKYFQFSPTPSKSFTEDWVLLLHAANCSYSSYPNTNVHLPFHGYSKRGVRGGGVHKAKVHQWLFSITWNYSGFICMHCDWFSNRNAWEVDLVVSTVPICLLVPIPWLVKSTDDYQNWEGYIKGYFPLFCLWD